MKKRGLEFKRQLVILLMLVILTLIAFLFDSQIILFIVSLRNVFFDQLFLSVAFISNGFIIFFFLTSLFLWKERNRRWILPLWLSIFLSFIISFIIKIIIKRPRPFHDGDVSVLRIIFNFIKDNFNIWNFSFPSFEAILVFAALPIISKEFKKFKYIWLIFACIIIFSRVYFGVHYLSDVLAGAIIGYLIGYTMMSLEENYQIGLKILQKLTTH